MYKTAILKHVVEQECLLILEKDK